MSKDVAIEKEKVDKIIRETFIQINKQEKTSATKTATITELEKKIKEVLKDEN